MLFSRPSFELATEYLYAWFGLGINEAQRLGYTVIDLPGDAAVLENILDALNKYRFSALFLGGHGSPTVLTGQDYQEIFKACQNDEAVAGNIAFLLSCFTGQELGPSMMEKGATAYLGWMVDFQFMVDTSKPILEDPLAEPFKEIVVEIISRILMGQNIKTVWDGGIAKCNEWISRLSPRSEYVWSQVIGAVKHDRDGFICLGEGEVSVPPPPVAVGIIPALSAIGLGAVLLGATVVKGKGF